MRIIPVSDDGGLDQGSGSQSGVPGPAAAAEASPSNNVLEMQILEPFPRLPQSQKLWGWEATI